MVAAISSVGTYVFAKSHAQSANVTTSSTTTKGNKGHTVSTGSGICSVTPNPATLPAGGSVALTINGSNLPASTTNDWVKITATTVTGWMSAGIPVNGSSTVNETVYQTGTYTYQFYDSSNGGSAISSPCSVVVS